MWLHAFFDAWRYVFTQTNGQASVGMMPYGGSWYYINLNCTMGKWLLFQCLCVGKWQKFVHWWNILFASKGITALKRTGMIVKTNEVSAALSRGVWKILTQGAWITKKTESSSCCCLNVVGTSSVTESYDDDNDGLSRYSAHTCKEGVAQRTV